MPLPDSGSHGAAPISIRARLTIWYSAVLAITLILFGLFVYTTLERNLDQEIDQSLEVRAREVNAAVRGFRIPLRAQRIEIPDVDAFAQVGTFVQIVDFDGEILSSSDNISHLQLPFDGRTLASARARHAYFERVTVGNEQLRLYNTPLLFAGQGIGLLQVAHRLREVEATLDQLRLVLVGGAFFSLLLSGLVGSALARAALRPIDRLTHTAKAIGESQDFGRRVEHAGPADEVGRLAATFNEMLSRLQEAYGRVEASLVAQRRFVADASHELRTPLTTVRGNASLLRRVQHMVPEDREEALQQISGEAERMSRLVTDLLTLARADAGLHLERSPVAIRPILEDVYRQVQLLANGRRILLGALTDGVVVAAADYLKQLILILIDNAIKYTPQGGEVHLGLIRADRGMEIVVRDTGVGIAPADLPNVFERFYRADHARSSGGTGLGLSIARWIVDEHEGQIDVASDGHNGTTVTVLFPLIEDQIAIEETGEHLHTRY